MPGGARVTLFSAQLLDEVRKGSVEALSEIAEEIVSVGRGTAPRDTGEYAGGMGVEVRGDTVFAVDTDPEAGWKEYGTVDTPAHASLTDAARQFGKYTGIQPGRR